MQEVVKATQDTGKHRRTRVSQRAQESGIEPGFVPFAADLTKYDHLPTNKVVEEGYRTLAWLCRPEPGIADSTGYWKSTGTR